MTAFRWIAGTPIAALVTAALFALMAAMISQPLAELPPPTPLPEIQITPKLVDPNPKPPKPIRPVKTEPPPIDLPRTTRGDKPVVTHQTPDHTPADVNPGDGTGALAAPLIRIAPPYPERCRARGAEGEVLVQFDVAADGSVVNPRIIESADRCFDRTVLKAVAGWKYPPAARNGAAVPRLGVIERFSFRLAD